jgi:hypothetical protein
MHLKEVTYLGDIVLYTTDEPLVAIAKIISQAQLVSLYLANANFLVCGIAHSFHNSLGHCVVLIFADQAREDTRQLMKLLVNPSSQPTVPAQTLANSENTKSG